MKELIENFLNYLSVERGLAHNTIISYRRDLIKFINFLNERKIKSLENVKRADVTSYLMGEKDRGFNPSSLARNLAAIKMFFKFLAMERSVLVFLSSFF